MAVHEAKERRVSIRDLILGPKVTKDDIFDLELRSSAEGWYDVLVWAMAMQPMGRRKLNQFLAGLRDGSIEVTVLESLNDVYFDPDPFELD